MAAGVVRQFGVVRQLGAARDHMLSVALDLFVHQGVTGTSLQMVADALGVTKAAVYRQFESKADLVLAVSAPALDGMTRLADAAEGYRSGARRRDAVLSGLVDLVVENRRLAAVMVPDPMVCRMVEEHPLLRSAIERVHHLLTGPDPDAETLVKVAVVGGGLMMVGRDPLLVELDDEVLRRHLLDAARRTLRLRAPAHPRDPA
jgi:AcrR family transcriptional regulator